MEEKLRTRKSDGFLRLKGLQEVLGSHLGPHNKGPGLRVQGLHQHLQAVRLLHSGTGTIIGLHGLQLSTEEQKERGPLSPRADFIYPEVSPARVSAPMPKEFFPH